MNRITNTSLTVIAASFAASFSATSAAHASSDKTAEQMMDTCIQQFVANNLSDYQGKVTVKKVGNSYSSSGASRSDNRVTVTAVSRTSGTKLGAATCELAHDGSIVYIESSPFAGS